MEQLPEQKSNGADGEHSRSKFRSELILLIVEVVIIGGAGFLLREYYNRLDSFEVIKWKQEAEEATTNTRDEKITIYKFGRETQKDIDLFFVIENASDYEIEGASVKRYENSFMNRLTQPHYITDVNEGYTITSRNPSSDYRFHFSSLSRDWVYQFNAKIRSRGGKAITHYARFELRDAKDEVVADQGLTFMDYLRLFIYQALILSIFIVFIIVVLVWKKGTS